MTGQDPSKVVDWARIKSVRISKPATVVHNRRLAFRILRIFVFMPSIDRSHFKQASDELTPAQSEARVSESSSSTEQRRNRLAERIRKAGTSRRSFKSWFVRYLAAVIAVGLAFLLRGAILQHYGVLPPFVTFYPAVLIVAILGDIWAGLFATGVAVLVATYWILPPIGQLAISRPADAIALVIFCTTGVFVSVVAELYNREHGRLADANAELQADLTEHDRTEQALQESEAKFRAIVENSHDGILFVDENNIITYRNPSYPRINGYTDEERLGHDLVEIVHPDDVVAFRQSWAEMLSQPETVCAMQYRIRHKDGSWRWIDTAAQNLLANTNVRAVVMTVRDITERKQAEQALIDSEERFQLAARANRDIIWDWDIVHDRVWFSERFFEVFGYDPATFPKGVNGWAQLVHPEDNWVIPFDGSGYASHEYRLRRADGAWAYVRDRSCLVRDAAGNPYRKIGVIMDISEEKRVQQALEESEERLRTIVELAPDGIFVVGKQGQIIEVNQAACKQLGYTRDQLLRLTIADFIGSRFANRVTTRLKGQIPDGSYESAHVRADGLEIPVEVGVAQVMFRGQPAFIGIARDISDRKRAEEQREALEQQLRQAQKMEAVGRLAGGIAHDFNNLLMVIESYTEMLQNDLPTHSPLRNNTREIAKAAERAAGLTRQMLAFSRKHVSAPMVLDLNALLNETTKMIRRLIGEDIEFRVSLAESLWAIKADSDQFVQVLMNLCVNARDAMPKGGTLTITTANVTVAGGKNGGGPPVQSGDYVKLTVTDTGAGISKEIQEKIFEPFFTTKETGKGTGLGLAMVYGIVKQSGGYVWVDSEPGKSTCFTIYLPRVMGAVVPAVSAMAEVRLRGTETLLVAEDEEAVREAVGDYLRSLGYTVLVASSGKQALSLAAEHAGHIDLLITDVVMPQISGRELSEMLGSVRPDLKTIYMSGYTDDAVLRHDVQEPRVSFLQKPFSLSTLGRKVRDLLGRTEPVQ